jgi:hypothetical protein
MFFKNNWLDWSGSGDEFKFILKQTVTQSVMNYHDELFENARNIRDIISGPLDLMFSGGIDSEVVLRIYQELKIPINVFIFKYENMLNYREFDHAIKVCTDLNVKHTVIDFNVKRFFENDAYDIWSTCKTTSSGWLPHMKLTEYLDNTPIIASGEPYWKKQDDGTWLFELEEDAKFWTIYHKTIGRTAITDWYEYRPEVILSYMQLPRVQQLINNQVPGKTSTVSSKALIHQTKWDDIIIRPKMVGFEKDLTPSKESKPDYMLEFDKHYCSTINSAIQKYTPTEIVDALCLP